MPSNYNAYLIANNLDVRVECPFEVIPGLHLRKPTAEELDRLRSLVAECCKSDMGWIAPYEIKWSRKDTEEPSYTFESLKDPDDWKYWLLEEEGGGNKAHEFSRIAQIVNPVIDLGIRLIYWKNNEQTTMGHAPISHHIGKRHWGFEGRHDGPIVDIIRETELNLIRALHNQLNAITDRHSFISSSLDTFSEVCKLSMYANLRIVGIFSVIESLITHAPRLTETLDSISHQISGKIILLNKRFEDSIPRPEAFGDVSDQKLWKKLYAYRSKVAHGQEPGFTGDLALLKDRPTVHNYLFEECQALLRFSIMEPQLVADLREC